MKLSLSFPFKPYIVSQIWGNPSTAYSIQFNDPNFTLHNGIDAIPAQGMTTWPVYCPVEGFRVLQVDYAPQGGGNEIWMISKDKYQIGDKECYALIALCHAKRVLVQAGDEPALGELLMIANSTGFSTHSHVHLGLYRVDYNGTWFTKLDQNGATGSSDPAPYFTNRYAIDQATLSTLIKSNWRYYQYVVGLK